MLRYEMVLGRLEEKSEGDKPLYKVRMMDGDAYRLNRKCCRKAAGCIISEYVSEAAIDYAFDRKWKEPIKDLVRMYGEMDRKFGGKEMTGVLMEKLPKRVKGLCREEHAEMILKYAKKKLRLR